ncbi:MAG TPA: alginate lyase family protein, partial [Saprospiraceae bacterium]|nr:alginate lyase family protein [Saprospiraceae bacterium]
MSIFLRYFHTLRHLRPIQVWYRAFYFFRKKWRQRTGHRYPLHREPAHIESLVFQDFLPAVATWWPSENRFRFLHIEQSFSEKTDWDFAAHGKLWQYNLHYFDCLHQKDLGPAEGFCLMHHFVEHLPDVPAALEPYPTALRIINWVKFLAKHDPVQAHTALDRSLYAQAYVLADHLEYHLLANHLLEDGFGLLFAALRYRDKYLFRRAAQVLDSELPEQILPDGGHYERSPMYHQILLGRMLDLHNLLANNAPLVDALTASAGIAPRCLAELGPRSQAMLGWMQAMTHPDGRMARFNDAVDGIAPAAAELVSYARRLGLEALAPFRGLSASGYFRPDSVVYTLIADAGPVGPDHQPGHAHSDTLSFEMSVGEEPFLVNTGISTYEKNGRRHYERSTAAHNTVTINDCEQSDTWSGHRVGRRAGRG